MNFLETLKFQRWAIGMIGKRGFIQYQLAPKGSQVSVNIHGRDVIVRKGTPDLMVTLSCFSGEFSGLRKLLPKDFGGVIVDAGGYIGTSAMALRELYPSARIIVVEPSEANIKILRKNLSGMDNLAIVYGALVGRAADAITLKNRGTGEWGFTSVASPKDNPNAEKLQSTPAYTLSQLVDDVSEIGILKLDIEGGEADVLRHDQASLKQIPVVFAELHDRIAEGCTDLFTEFSKDRRIETSGDEKYLSIRTEG